MNTVYVDYTNGALGNKNVKFHGGGDFCRFILWNMSSLISVKGFDKEIIVLWPKNYEFLSEEEKEIRSRFKVMEIQSLLDVDYKDNVLFLPLIDGFRIQIINSIKKVYPSVRIMCVLHGVRLLDSCKYDKYDSFYYDGIRSFAPYLWIRRWFAALLSKKFLKKNLPLAEKVFTVSNNSMQRINQCGNTQYLKFFYRNVSSCYEDQIQSHIYEDYGRYVLFINANRYEKNFIRTLLAFKKYIYDENAELKMVVTGLNNKMFKKLIDKRIVDVDFLKKYLINFDYVDSEHLKYLYNKCQFLLYTSKSEGYGLPPLEAMEAGKPTIASSTTSVPEVLGMAAYYVNPYSIDDIKRGISYMNQKQNQKRYIELLAGVKEFLHKRGRYDISCLLSEILN